MATAQFSAKDMGEGNTGMSEQPPQYQIGDIVNGHRWTGTTWEPVQVPPPPPPPGEPIPPVNGKKSSSAAKGCGLILLAVIVIGVLAALFGGGGGDDAATGTSTSADATQEATEPAEEATEPSEEATTEEATPAPEPASPYENFGVFDPVKKSDSGDSVVKLGDASGATAIAVTATHKGDSNFAIEGLNSDNDSTDLLVNEIGSYSGTTLLVVGDVTKLKITANGPWTVKLSPVDDMKEIEVPAVGKGDKVLLYSGDAADWKFTHKGESNFAVQQLNGDGQDLLVNEIGSYSGVVPVSAGPSIVTINADGAWTIKEAS